MADDRPNRSRKRAVSPLDTVRLEDIALAYVARFATSAARLEAYLRRKLRERGWAGEGEPDPSALVSRYVELGYVDDRGFARARAKGLLRRGYGPRRVDEALGAAGIDRAIRETVRADEAGERRAALTLARKRGFGPFGAEPPDRDRREKQIAAMVRAGHSYASARELVDAESVDQAEAWAGEAIEEGED